MYNIKIGDNIYGLPRENYYIEKLKYLMKDNTVMLDDLNDIQKAEALDIVFSFVAMTLCSLDDDFGPDDVVEEKINIRKDIFSVDSISKWLTKKGNISRSNDVVIKFIERMLKYYNKVLEEDYPLNIR